MDVFYHKRIEIAIEFKKKAKLSYMYESFAFIILY